MTEYNLQIGIDSSKAKNGADVAVNSADKITSSFSKATDSINKSESSLNRLKTAYMSVGQVMAVYFAGKVAISLIKSLTDINDELYKMSQRIGISVEELSSLAYAGKLADIDLSSLGMSMQFLSRNIANITSETSEQAIALKAMGINYKNNDGTIKKSTELLNEIADSFANSKDGIDKTAVSMALFGRSGTAMIPLLNGGSKGLKDMAEEAKNAGLIISEDLAKKSEELNDNLSRLGMRGTAFKNLIAKELVPRLNDMAIAILDSTSNVGGFEKAFASATTVLDGFGKVAQGVATGIKAISTVGEIIGTDIATIITAKQADSAKKGYEIISQGAEMGYSALDKLKNGLTETTEATKKFNTEKEKSSDDEKGDFNYAGLKAAIERQEKFLSEIEKLQSEIDQAGARTLLAQQNMAVANVSNAFPDFDNGQLAEYIELLKKKQAIEIETAAINASSTLSAKLQADQLNELIPIMQSLGVTEQEVTSIVRQSSIARLNASREWADGAKAALLQYVDDTTNYGKQAANAVTSSLSSIEDGFVNLITGTESLSDAFDNMVTSILADIARMAVQKSITTPIASALSSIDLGNIFASAHGNVFNSSVSGSGGLPSISDMTNSVISKPTLFKFANGGTLGAVAEAGRSEAILPLERTSGGDLGVKASVDSGGVKNVKVEIINESGQQVQATSSTSQMDAGNLVVQIVIDAINRNKNGLRDIVGSV